MTDLSSARSRDDPEVAGRGADIIFSHQLKFMRGGPHSHCGFHWRLG